MGKNGDLGGFFCLLLRAILVLISSKLWWLVLAYRLELLFLPVPALLAGWGIFVHQGREFEQSQFLQQHELGHWLVLHSRSGGLGWQALLAAPVPLLAPSVGEEKNWWKQTRVAKINVPILLFSSSTHTPGEWIPGTVESICHLLTWSAVISSPSRCFAPPPPRNAAPPGRCDSGRRGRGRLPRSCGQVSPGKQKRRRRSLFDSCPLTDFPTMRRPVAAGRWSSPKCCPEQRRRPVPPAAGLSRTPRPSVPHRWHFRRCRLRFQTAGDHRGRCRRHSVDDPEEQEDDEHHTGGSDHRQPVRTCCVGNYVVPNNRESSLSSSWLRCCRWWGTGRCICAWGRWGRSQVCALWEFGRPNSHGSCCCCWSGSWSPEFNEYQGDKLKRWRLLALL